MNCDESKKLIKQGRAQEAARHISQCEDCAAFADDFSELAELFPFEEAESKVVENELLLRKTVALARAELRAEVKAESARAEVNRGRIMVGALIAAVCAPVILFLNYYIASAGRTAFSEWTAPLFGDLFFFTYIMLSLITGFFAYGALTIFMAGAGKVLRVESAAGRYAV